MNRRRLTRAAVVASTPLLALTLIAAPAHADELPATLDGAGLLERIEAPTTTTADGPVWSPTATGFAVATGRRRSNRCR